MPRTLPWLASDTGKSRSKRPRTDPNSEHTRGRSSPTVQNVRNKPAARDSKALSYRPREPSSSPPPPLPSVSSIEPMRSDGTDDDWIMVEDEFLSTAQQYTRHLHHEEYKRLKHAATLKNNDALNAIQRPTYGESLKVQKHLAGKNKTSIMREEAEHLAALNGNPVKRESDDDNFDDEDIIIGDRNLASLMHGNREERDGQKPELSSLASLKLNSRAAAGYRRPDRRPDTASNPKRLNNVQHDPDPIKYESHGIKQLPNRNDDDTGTTSDDDLDAAVRTIRNSTVKVSGTTASKDVNRPLASPHKPFLPSSRDKENKQHTSRGPTDRSNGHIEDKTGVSRGDQDQKPRGSNNGDQRPPTDAKRFKSDGPSFDSKTSSSIVSWRKTREAKRKQAQSTNLDEIPTFLV